jgi:hypothetical protein
VRKIFVRDFWTAARVFALAGLISSALLLLGFSRASGAVMLAANLVVLTGAVK